MRDRPQADHADLGLIDDDNTPDMRTPPAATRGFSKPNHPPTTKEKFYDKRNA